MNIYIYRVYACVLIACKPRKHPTFKSVIYRDLSKFILYGITLKGLPTATLENATWKKI